MFRKPLEVLHKERPDLIIKAPESLLDDLEFLNQYPESWEELRKRNNNFYLNFREEIYYRLGEAFKEFVFHEAVNLSKKQLALITLLQYIDRKTDRQAITFVNEYAVWQYAIGILPGHRRESDLSILNLFRERLLDDKKNGLLGEVCPHLMNLTAGERIGPQTLVLSVSAVNAIDKMLEVFRKTLANDKSVEPDFLKEYTENPSSNPLTHLGKLYSDIINYYRPEYRRKNAQILGNIIEQQSKHLPQALRKRGL